MGNQDSKNLTEASVGVKVPNIDAETSTESMGNQDLKNLPEDPGFSVDVKVPNLDAKGTNIVSPTDGSPFTEIIVDASLELENFSKTTVSMRENLVSLGVSKVESVSEPEINLLRPPPKGCYGEHGFITAIRTAYDSHVPLMLSPDHIWTLIAQGISKHIEHNAEKFRDLFVRFDGKQLIRIRRDEFVKGEQENDWAGCFTECSKQIERFVGKKMKAKLCPNFSTTDPIAKACHELGMMDCLKSYFDYRYMTMCGISKVKLQGSEEDWKKLETSLSILDELELSDWRKVLEPILNNLWRASAGKPTDKNFWNLIYKTHIGKGSGSYPTVDGWSTNFFLYIKERKRENFRPLETLYKEIANKKHKVDKHRMMMWRAPGVPRDAIHGAPVGVSKTPFIWEHLDTDFAMFFYSGFVGAKFEDGYISPVLGWAVGEQGEAAQKKAQKKVERKQKKRLKRKLKKE